MIPEPKWLSLSEAIAWLTKRGASEDDIKNNLQRACRDDIVLSRGRCRHYFKHNTQVPLQGVTWDDARVYWAESRFAIDPEHGRGVYDFTDVEVSRESLEWWIQSDAPISKTSTLKDKGGRPPKYDWGAFLTEAGRYLYVEGQPGSKSAFVEIMAQWCLNTWGDEPSASTIKAKISPLYDAIMGEESDNN